MFGSLGAFAPRLDFALPDLTRHIEQADANSTVTVAAYTYTARDRAVNKR